jgi:Lrp/AsnC family leucine-responsive transcriptional regulator
MTAIDVKDRKILYQLDLDSRQSFRSIGRKVGLSKNSVATRVKKLEDEGVIKAYWTAIDTYKLGYQVFRIFISFLDVTKEIKQDIIDYFINEKNAWAVVSVKGEIDLDVILWVKDIQWFNTFWHSTLKQFGRYFERQTYSIMHQIIAFKKTFLLPEGQQAKDLVFHRMRAGVSPVQIDAFDYQLLNHLSVNARTPLVDLAQEFECSPQTVRQRLQNLQKKGVIRAYRVHVDLKKLGLYKYGLDIYLLDHSQRKLIFSYLMKQPYVEYIDDAMGWADVEFELIVGGTDDVMDIMDEISSEFSGAIRKQSFMTAEKYHHEKWLPEIGKENFNKK